MAGGLLDAGTGGLTGLQAGVSTASGLKELGLLGGMSNPWVLGGIGALSVGSGLLSYFGGQDERRLMDRANKQSLELQQQQVQGGRMSLLGQRRQMRQQRSQDRKTERFRNAFGKAFARAF